MVALWGKKVKECETVGFGRRTLSAYQGQTADSEKKSELTAPGRVGNMVGAVVVGLALVGIADPVVEVIAAEAMKRSRDLKETMDHGPVKLRSKKKEHTRSRNGSTASQTVGAGTVPPPDNLHSRSSHWPTDRHKFDGYWPWLKTSIPVARMLIYAELFDYGIEIRFQYGQNLFATTPGGCIDLGADPDNQVSSFGPGRKYLPWIFSLVLPFADAGQFCQVFKIPRTSRLLYTRGQSRSQSPDRVVVVTKGVSKVKMKLIPMSVIGWNPHKLCQPASSARCVNTSGQC
ncbi:hypothetical protein C8R44DRAFT_745206 [Mycena epipterygia]|nr:hypothetical protein C8R44DRAFT_745206 [Mycena epipterygia]